MTRALAALLAGLSCAVLGSPAPASEAGERERIHAPLPGSDGVYGRLDGSVALAAGAGAELEAGEPRAALRLSGHYLWTAGAYARYSESFNGATERPLRVASLGVDLRPLFLPRFGLDLQQGPALLDLTLDSVSLSAGAYFGEPRGASFGDARGFELGLGCGVPLLGEAQGPWLEARAERRFADRGEGAWLLTLALSWHVLTLTTDPDP